ncbi:TetR/AcrR family transcriptional regulator [Sphingomonas oryzagri]
MGRKRLFEIEVALDAAMLEFWKKGFEGTSLTDLTDAMGIEKPSLYRFFGNKDNLFRLALGRYEERHLQFFSQALAAPTAYSVARIYLMGLIRTVTLPGMPTGALDLNAGIACGTECEGIREKLVEWRAAYEKALIKRFRFAKRSGDLSGDIRPQALARYLMSVSTGIALQAKSGASRRTLREIAECALQVISAAGGPHRTACHPPAP